MPPGAQGATPCFATYNGQSTASSGGVPGGPLVGQAVQGYSNLRAVSYNTYKERIFCINLVCVLWNENFGLTFF
ncbi:uncharacterized protein SKDI_10G3200 [Saccharomyces kudriavzevii IFO 1802]|uniref:Uncharacterized protein n=1 Tax=Saccharomyces kudriavzevii (strain ATCC MYA-4449 / AS 2.2408 / CBS 8840 / NBRC 1802 / NCYC 2889) TaxID=226230 RepID=A0AA35NIJ2_SACK1|nr:uncharacterized protein SKDI_10G3200 [Saccharomyces kudriavzevii IFO 1802]CAI4044020.1 hypothetical protein SKDI_10G3200 [Saccharomyces kudriavzevii IFO 1802]